jgi:glutaredoxin-like protein NrdH
MVQLYTLPACVQCDATKRYFKRYDIQFEEIKLQDDPGALEKVQAMGHTAAPVVVSQAGTWSGFRRDMLEALKGFQPSVL